MIAPRLDEFLTRNSAVLEILEMIESKDTAVVRPAQILCNDDYCEVALDDGTALYRDDHHLSTLGAKHVSGVFDPVFSKDP